MGRWNNKIRGQLTISNRNDKLNSIRDYFLICYCESISPDLKRFNVKLIAFNIYYKCRKINSFFEKKVMTNASGNGLKQNLIIHAEMWIWFPATRACVHFIHHTYLNINTQIRFNRSLPEHCFLLIPFRTCPLAHSSWDSKRSRICGVLTPHYYYNNVFFFCIQFQAQLSPPTGYYCSYINMILQFNSRLSVMKYQAVNMINFTKYFSLYLFMKIKK